MTRLRWLIGLAAIVSGLAVFFFLYAAVSLISGDFPPCQDGNWDREKQTCVPDPNWQGG